MQQRTSTNVIENGLESAVSVDHIQSLERRNKHLMSVVVELQAENNRLLSVFRKNDEVKAENAKLRLELGSRPLANLKETKSRSNLLANRKIALLEAENAALRSQITELDALKADNAQLRLSIQELEDLKAENAQLRLEIEQLASTQNWRDVSVAPMCCIGSELLDRLELEDGDNTGFRLQP